MNYSFPIIIASITVFSGIKAQSVIDRVDGHVNYLQTTVKADQSRRMSMANQGCTACTTCCMEQRMVRAVDYDQTDGAYTDPKVSACVVAIRDQESLVPFFVMWSDFKRQGKTEAQLSEADTVFLNESSRLIFVFYNNMIDTLSDGKRAHRVTVEEIIILYNAISQLPIGRLLDLLDDLLHQVMALLEKYDFGPDKSLFVWLKTNWWFAPVAIGSVIANLLGYGPAHT